MWQTGQNQPGHFFEALGASRRGLICAGTCAAALLALFLLHSSINYPFTPSPPHPFTPSGVSGWQIELPPEIANVQGQKFGGFLAPGKVFFVPAGAPFSLQVRPAGTRGALQDALPAAPDSWLGQGGKLAPGDGVRQIARAPSQPGLYHLAWRSDAAPGALVPASSAPGAPQVSADSSELVVLVLAAAETEIRGERTMLKVNGKSIGGYHDPLKSTVKRVREHAADYQAPKFFAALTSESAKLRLGPDFDLGDLIAFKDYIGADGKKVFTSERHTDVFPLRPELIEKLILLRERLRQKGVAVTRFGVTSAFRTPDYNRSIGGATFSRHCYGDAIDLYIDEDHDHKMDDLNGDGKIDRKDGLVIANACRELELEGKVVPGGIGVYEWDGDESVRSHVHIDCRGYISRWGQIGSGKFKKSFKWWPAAEFQDEENGE